MIKEKIEQLKKEILFLEKQLEKNEKLKLLDSAGSENKLLITVYWDFSKGIEESLGFNTFNEMFKYLGTRFNEGDKLILDFYENGVSKSNEWTDLNYETQNDVLENLSILNPYTIYRMDFGVVDQHDNFKIMITVRTPFINEYANLISNRYSVLNDNTLEKLNEMQEKSKSWSLF